MNSTHTRYPGAQPFSDDDFSRKVFFGREQASITLTDQVLANRMVVVYAKSGLGKTSLLNAGVARRLRDEGYLPLIVRVNDVQQGPLVSVLEGIRAEAERQQVEYVPGMPDSLWTFFKTAEFWRGDLLLTPVLILDQFEELFTLQSEQHRTSFLTDLSYLVRGVRPPSQHKRMEILAKVPRFCVLSYPCVKISRLPRGGSRSHPANPRSPFSASPTYLRCCLRGYDRSSGDR